MEIKQKLSIHQERGHGKYLGLPETFQGSKVTILSSVQESLQQKISVWQAKFLSPGGKEVLLKAIAFALPTYTMACFKIPITICKKLASLMADFWWKNNNNTRGMHWKGWDQLSKPKATGGLGFKDIESFNLSLLGKQIWRMLTYPDSLMTKIYKARYFRKSSPLAVALGTRPSYAWKSIHAAQDLMNQGCRKVIGNGASTSVWLDKWLGRKEAIPIQMTKTVPSRYQNILTNSLTVKDLMRTCCREWNIEEQIVSLISQIRPGGMHSNDVYTWDYTTTGQYTVKSSYWVCENVVKMKKKEQEYTQPSLDAIYQKVWKSETCPKVHHFLWKCISNCLPVAGNLAYRHLIRDGSCYRRGQKSESINHLLFQCPFARLVWAVSHIPAPPHGQMADSIYTNMFRVLSLGEQQDCQDEAYLVPRIL